MEIAQADDVQTESAHRREVLQWRVERSCIADASREVEMKVIHEGLVARNRLERVVMGERQNILTRSFGLVRARIKIDRHPLDGSRRRIVECKILNVFRILFAV